MRSSENVERKISGGANGITVYAAGALCWRLRKKKLELLLIHRERYNDWSWPKGKLDKGETLAECAVREVWEEVNLPIVLGIPLPSITYVVKSGLKKVHYWASQVDDLLPHADGKEVNMIKWVTPETAREMLSNPSDIHPLDKLVEAFQQGVLATWPLLIVRHAKAKARSSWPHTESDRPLTARGKQQALNLQGLLQAWNPMKILTSGWIRCLTTVSPYAQSSKAHLKIVSSLTEDEHNAHPDKTAWLVEKLFTKCRPVAVCTHRPVLPVVLATLAFHMEPLLAKTLPMMDPHLSPGEVLVAHVSVQKPGRIVSVEQHKPYKD